MKRSQSRRWLRLGRIDDKSATDAIAKAKDKATGAIKTAVLDAYLRCADRLAAKGEKDAARAIYKQLYAAGEPMPVRVAAARGMIVTAGDKTGDVVVEMLKSTDKQIQTAAIATLKEVAKTDVIKAAAEQIAESWSGTAGTAYFRPGGLRGQGGTAGGSVCDKEHRQLRFGLQH